MRTAGYLLGLLVFLLCSQAWAEQSMGIATPYAVFARPFDTTTYASGDLVANSAVAANVVPMQWNIVTAPNNGVFIRRANIRKVSTGVVLPNFRLHLFTVSPTSAVGDNGVYSSTSIGWFCDLDVNMYTTDPFSDGNAGIGVPNNGSECAVNPVASTIYGLLEARGAYVPASGELFTVGLEIYVPGGGSGAAVASAPSWVTPQATLDYDFANQRYWNGGLATNYTFTRATAETCISSTGALSYVTSNNPCITDLGYQSWPAATNLLLQSQFAATWTATRSTLTANAATSPDGTADAATLVEDATVTSTHLTTQSISKAASALPYAFSVYAKAGTRTRIDLQLDDNAGNGAVMVCDLTAKAVGVTTAGVGGAGAFTVLAANVYGYSNGWTRCSMTATSNTATTLVSTIFLDSGAGTAAISNSYSGDGASGVTIFGAQTEVQLATSFVAPSPYIPTTVASATRNADVMVVGIGGRVGTQYSMFASGTSFSAVTNNGARDLMYLDDGTANNRYIMRYAGSQTPTGILLIGGVTQYTIAGAPTAQNSRGKLAMSMAPGSQLFCSNGAVGASVASASVATILAPTSITNIHVGNSTVAAAQFEGFVDRITFFGSTFLNNADLIALTR